MSAIVRTLLRSRSFWQDGIETKKQRIHDIHPASAWHRCSESLQTLPLWAKVWLSIVTLGGLAIVLMPSLYRAESKLLVRLGRENVALDPTANLGQGPISAVPVLREAEMNTVVESLKSRVLVEQVVDALTPESILAGECDWWERWIPNRSAPRDRAIAKLAKRLEIAVIRKSNLVSVVCDAHEPELARKAEEAFIERFLDFHRGLHRNRAARAFFTEQADLVGAELKRTEAELLELKNRAGVVSLEEQKRLLLAQVDALQQDLQTTDARMHQSEAKIAALQSQQASLPERIVLEKTSGFSNLASDNMREQLYALEVKEKELASKYTDENVLLRQTRQQLAEAREIQKSEREPRTQITEGRGKAYTEVEIALVTEKAELSAWRARSESRASQLAAARNELVSLNHAQTQLASLERELELRQTSFEKYAQSREQARIDEALEADRITNIGIVQPPAVLDEAIRPNRWLLACLVAIFATFAAAAAGPTWHWVQTDPNLARALSGLGWARPAPAFASSSTTFVQPQS